MFATFTKIFAISEGLLPEDPRLTRMFRYITLEVGLIVGILLILAGAGAWVLGLEYWRIRQFGPLDPEKTLRIVIPGVVCFTLGFPDCTLQFFSQRSRDVPPMKDAEDLFDQYAAAYEQALSNAIAPSGESREYFAEGRVAWLKRCLEEMKQPVDSLLDFGCGDGATTPMLVEALNANSAVGRGRVRQVTGDRAEAPCERTNPIRIDRRIPALRADGSGVLQRRIPPHFAGATRCGAGAWSTEPCAREEFFPCGKIIRGAWRRAT